MVLPLAVAVIAILAFLRTAAWRTLSLPLRISISLNPMVTAVAALVYLMQALPPGGQLVAGWITAIAGLCSIPPLLLGVHMMWRNERGGGGS